jgi:hypothetical protein
MKVTIRTARDHGNAMRRLALSLQCYKMPANQAPACAPNKKSQINSKTHAAIRSQWKKKGPDLWGDRDGVAVCDLWFVVCDLWFVVCGLWFVVCGLWFVVCGS